MLIDKRVKYVERTDFPDMNTLYWEELNSLESECLQNSTVFLTEFHS